MVLLVKASDLVLGVLLELDFEHTFVVNHAFEDAPVGVGTLLVYVSASDVTHVLLLVPQLEKQCSMVILQGLQVRVNFDVRCHDLLENVPSCDDASRVHEDGANQALIHISKDLQVVLT